MDIILVLLFGWSVFATTNADFFNRVEELKQQGYTWKYTGRQRWYDTGDNPALVLENYNGGKPFTYWKIGETK